MQTELTKFYRPITKSQKATAREITEGLRPIREGIEKLPQAKKKESADEKFARIIKKLEEREQELEEGEKEEEEEEEEEDLLIGETARYHLNKLNTDETFGIRKKGGHHYIGNKHVIITGDSDIIIKESGDKFLGTDGLWELITSKDPQEELDYDEDDLKEYKRLTIKTNALHKGNNPNNPYPKSSRGDKWLEILSPI